MLDLPILVTNAIGDGDGRPACDALDNALLAPEQIDAAGANADVPVLFVPGDAVQVDQAGTFADAFRQGGGDGLGPLKPDARPEDGLGSAAAAVAPPSWAAAAVGVGLASVVFAVLL